MQAARLWHLESRSSRLAPTSIQILMSDMYTHLVALGAAYDIAETIRSLVPRDVAVRVEAFDLNHHASTDIYGPLADAIPARRAEFAAGRRCACAALTSLGCPETEILRGSLGEPIWPRHYSGSISHEAGIAAAIAFKLGLQWKQAGLDIMLTETVQRQNFSDLADVILTPEEKAATGSGSDVTLRAFMLKEAAIKIASPALGRLVDFQEISLQTTGEAYYRVTIPGFNMHGRTSACRSGIIALAWL